MKKNTGIAILLFTALALAIPAGAQMYGKGMSEGMRHRSAKRFATLARIHELRADLTIEQRDAIRKLRDAFLHATVELRNTIREKRVEFRDLLKSENPDKSEVMAVRQELMDLNTVLFQKKFDLRLEQRRIIKSDDTED